MTSISSTGRGRISGLTLAYPMSLGVFDKYEDAQKAVDYLSDREFPVENCMIVGTDLRQVERVTGRLTLGRVALAGLVTGIWMGLFVGLIFALFAPSGDAFTTVLWSMLFGAVFALVWALIGHGFTRGQRDFTSISQVVATRYEVLTEHKYAQQARDLLMQMPGAPGSLTYRPVGQAPGGPAPGGSGTPAPMGPPQGAPQNSPQAPPVGSGSPGSGSPGQPMPPQGSSPQGSSPQGPPPQNPPQQPPNPQD